MATIVPATTEDLGFWTWGTPCDSILGREKLHVFPILAWSIEGESVLPVTPLGKAEPGGCWICAVNDRWLTSDGDILENQTSALIWLRTKYANN
jgi:hypothetical protein